MTTSTTSTTTHTIQTISRDRIVRDENQPRKTYDQEALERLGHSLRDQGQLQAIGVRSDEQNGKYVIVYGERRWMAAETAGMKELQCVVLEINDPSNVAIVQLIENCHREDVPALERARAFEQLMDMNRWTAAELARRCNVSAPTVSRSLALLKLPPDIKKKLESQELSAKQAYELSTSNGEDTQPTEAPKANSSEPANQKAQRSPRPSRGGRPQTTFRIKTKKATVTLSKFSTKQPSKKDQIDALKEAIGQINPTKQSASKTSAKTENRRGKLPDKNQSK